MVNQITQLNNQLANNLTNTVKELHNNLQAIQPFDNETAQLITYTLVGAALVGIGVYYYIKQQESI